MNATTTYGLWGHVDNALTWLDQANGRGEKQTVVHLLKLSEEVGEVASAYIGMTGQNPRKGVTHTREDVASELCDVVITALVALASITGSTTDAQAALARHLARRGPRLAALLNTTPERTSA